MKITNLVTIKGYEAGKGGNLLVSLDDQLCQDIAHGKKGRHVNMMICTAFLKEESPVLMKHVDVDTRADRVIVVSKKFMRLGNKKQLALLLRENIANQTESTNSEVCRSEGNIAAYEAYGKIVAGMAISKADKVIRRSEKKCATGLHHQYKKDARLAKKAAKAAAKYGLDEEIFDDFMEVEDVEPEVAPAN